MKIKNLVQGVIVGGTMVVSLGVANAAAPTAVDTAGDVCAAGSASGFSTSLGFLVTGFTPKCSTNTVVSAMVTADSLAVKSASTKGKTYYGGTTASGTVGACSGASGTFATYTAPTASASGC
jgi:hypothetical protein